MRRITAGMAMSALLLGLIAASCGGGKTKTVSVPGGGKVSVSDKLPDNFPKDFPVYKGAKIVASYSGKQDNQEGFFVSWETGDAVDKVKSFYSDAFDKGPWKSSGTFDSSDSSVLSASNADAKQSATLTISRTGNTTSIGAFLGNDAGLSNDTPTSGNKTSTTSGGSAADDKTSTAEAKTASAEAQKSPTSSALPPEAKVSKDFPGDRVPFPGGARVTSSGSFGSGGSKTFTVELYVKDTPENVASFFETELPKKNWTSGFSSESNGAYVATFTSSDPTATSDSVSLTVEASETSGYAKATLLVSVGG